MSSDEIVTPKKQHPHKALSPAFIRNVDEPGKYADGNCLYLFVDEDLNKKFVQILTILGLG